MKVRIAGRMPHLTGPNIPPSSHSCVRTSKRNPHPRFLRCTRDAFLVTGFLALGYCSYVLLDTKLYQAYQPRRFQRDLTTVWLVKAGVDGVGEQPAPVLPSGALGKIEITRIGLAAMILEGIDGRTLRRAVGHIPGTPLPGQQGNAAIAGHRDTFFRPLRKIQHNDEIKLTTLDGTYRYLVDTTQVVAPEDT